MKARSTLHLLKSKLGLRPTTPAPLARDFSHERFAYPWLNAVVEDIANRIPHQRASYTWGLAHAAYLAHSLGVSRISALELGVAGGNGLVALDAAALEVARIVGVGIDVFGFDTGQGLPPPVDVRDAPNLWSGGDFPMDEAGLRSRLRSACLVLGRLRDTLPGFLLSKPAPIALISFDVDLYTSTMEALPLLEADAGLLLPRVHCFFDDILGFTFSERNGERLAIAEFNRRNDQRYLSPIYGLRHYVPQRYFNANWTEKYFMAHIVDHPLYGANDGLVRIPRMDLA